MGDVDCHEEVSLLAFETDEDHQECGKIRAIGVGGVLAWVDGRKKSGSGGFASING